MSERKMVSIPADTHDSMMAWLAKQGEATGFKITASSFVSHAIQSAMSNGAIYVSKSRRGKAKK